MIYIRAEGNAQIGAGHLMRCMTIAKQLQKTEEIVFLCAEENSVSMVQAYGFEVKRISGKSFSLEEATFIGKQYVSTDCMHKELLLVDSYQVTKDYIKVLREKFYVFYMDDMCGDTFPADAIINYNAFAEKAAYLKLYKDQSITFFCGASYVPLREQFSNNAYVVREKLEKVLLTTGGSDQFNIAGYILDTLLHNNETCNLEYHVVVGPFNPYYEKLCTMSKEFPQIVIHSEVRQMAELMSRCDAAITAGGTTIYELCAVGVPFICFSYAENQDKLVNFIRDKKITMSAGRYHVGRERCMDKIMNALIYLMQSRTAREICSTKEHHLVDGLGAERLARQMIEWKDQ